LEVNLLQKIDCESCKHRLCASQVPIFSFLSREELLKIVGMTGHIAFKKGELITGEGDVSNTLFIINEGQVKLSKVTRDGKEQIVHILTSGDFFGELNIFGGREKNNFSAWAISPVKICTLNKESMDKILLANPEIALKLIKEISKRLADTENLAQNLATKDAELRIAYILLELTERYSHKTSRGVELALPITREEMASYAGLTRETISRKLALLQDQGIIEFEGNKNVIIKDEAYLRDMLL